MFLRYFPRFMLLVLFGSVFVTLNAQETRLLRQPNLGKDRIAFTYGGDVWTAGQDGNKISRLTATPAIEEHPHFSPNGQQIAFTSNRDGSSAVYVVDAEGALRQYPQHRTRATQPPLDGTRRWWTRDPTQRTMGIRWQLQLRRQNDRTG